MMGPRRIAFGRISQETNSYSPVLTTLSDFEHTHWLEGADLLQATGPDGTEVPGFMQHAELSGFVRAAREVGGRRIELVPLFSAWTIPGGPLDCHAFEALQTCLRRTLQDAGALDGVFLSMHGAMGAEGVEDPEATLLALIRGIVGPDLPVAVTLDLHAQLTREFVEYTTIIAGYRTNPHRDHARTGYRAGLALVRTVLGEQRPTMAWRTLPMVLGGGTTVDVAPTMWPVFGLMNRMERDPRVLYVSLFMCHIWNQAKELGWSVTVVTDGDEELAAELADQLADAAWAVRHQQPPEFSSAHQAIADARRARLRRRLGTVCMCDASDIVSAGAPGENTRLLKALLTSARGLLCYVPIRDAFVVDELWNEAIGASVATTVGGRLDPANEPLFVRGVVCSRHHTGYGRTIVLDLGHVQLVVTERAPMAMRPSFYRDVGLSPWRPDITVVKSLFPFRLYYALHNRKTIYVRTAGATDLDLVTKLEFDCPVWPLQAVEHWRPTDRRRRLGTESA